MGTRLIRKDQRGFTLVELLVAIAIAGLITGGITAAIMQVLNINHRASNHMICSPLFPLWLTILTLPRLVVSGMVACSPSR
jgi:prepilin-type N-terminal cleavage/methylation domain-containing protein